MKRITENSRIGRAICAISTLGINDGHDRVCAAMAWIVDRFGDWEPELRDEEDDWNEALRRA